MYWKSTVLLYKLLHRLVSLPWDWLIIGGSSHLELFLLKLLPDFFALTTLGVLEDVERVQLALGKRSQDLPLCFFGLLLFFIAL